MSLASPWMLALLLPTAAVAWLMVRARGLQREVADRLKGVTAEVALMEEVFESNEGAFDVKESGEVEHTNEEDSI